MNKIYGWLFLIAAFIFPLGLYLKTLSPTYIPVDSAEFALCMHTWGLCHPPGFPLYVLVGKVFTSIFPFGSVIFKANLLSAIFGAGTILLVYLIQLELRVNKLLALLVSLILAVTSAFWEYSISADVFTFATFWIALSLLLTFKNRIYLALFALGVSASHFYLSVVSAPIIFWYFYGLKLKIRVVMYSIAVFALGFFPQAILFLRMQQNPDINWGHAQGVSGFIDYIRRKEFGNIFLLSNPALKFSLFKFFDHIVVFLKHVLANFAIVLPLLVVFSAIFGQLKDKKYLFLVTIFLVGIIVQLFLLSTIDPLEKDSAFQISKFYLPSMVPLVLLIGLSLQKIMNKWFEDDIHLPSIFLGVIIFIYFMSNFQSHSLSKNYFSENLVFDAMDQLPEESIAITVSHVMNFGTRYEQIVNDKYRNITILYFPNEKNLDNESYYPEIFEKDQDMEFVDAVEKGKTLGKAERYILSTIARNLDKEIYIFQGSFEERFFLYLKPYLQPHGLWWKIELDLRKDVDFQASIQLLEGLRNEGVKYDDLHLRQQQQDTLSYALSYHTTAIVLASKGEYEEALSLLIKSNEIRKNNENIQIEINLIEETELLEFNYDSLNISNQEKLGNNLFMLKNYQKCAQVFDKLVAIDSRAEIYNNLASCLASDGNKSQAIITYEKALEIDPELLKAKQGLGELIK